MPAIESRGLPPAVAAARERFDLFVRIHHRAAAEEFETTEVPCYWRRKAPCGGGDGGCREPLHSCIGCGGPVRHTVYYRDNGRMADGRFASPAETWRTLREAGL